jgi:hypothetical protein
MRKVNWLGEPGLGCPVCPVCAGGAVRCMPFCADEQSAAETIRAKTEGSLKTSFIAVLRNSQQAWVA